MSTFDFRVVKLDATTHEPLALYHNIATAALANAPVTRAGVHYAITNATPLEGFRWSFAESYNAHAKLTGRTLVDTLFPGVE